MPAPHTSIAIVGTGPAGLMAATRLSTRSNCTVHLYEKRTGLGRKLLIAGSSGLNISHSLPILEFAEQYRGWNAKHWKDLLTEFGTREWIDFIEKELGLETFLGTSDRYFVREMKASGLLKKWVQLLESRGVVIHPDHELIDFSSSLTLEFKTQGRSIEATHDAVVLALGGGSWEDETPAWLELLRRKGLQTEAFSASNVGFEVRWKPGFLAEAEGKPLKKIRFESKRGKKDGELVVTRYGLEGTPIYFWGETGECFIDLKPDLTEGQILERLSSVKENLAPLRRVKQKLALCEASQALLFHHLAPADKLDLKKLVARIKHFPLRLEGPRPLSEAISSRGGLALSEVSEHYELKKFPGIYCAGEMLAWDAPTGGFLIQAAVSMGSRVGEKLQFTRREEYSPNHTPS